jgi:hypothetical protein
MARIAVYGFEVSAGSIEATEAKCVEDPRERLQAQAIDISSALSHKWDLAIT